MGVFKSSEMAIADHRLESRLLNSRPGRPHLLAINKL